MNALQDLDATQALRYLPRLQVIDVRQPEEFAGALGHLPGALCIPLAQLGGQLAQLDRDAEILVVCRSGARSRSGGEALLAAGFSRVFNLVGGMMRWIALGLPVEEGAAS